MIKVETRKAIKLKGEESLFISSPYNPKLVEYVRTLKNRWWHAKLKQWEVEVGELDTVQQILGLKTTHKPDSTEIKLKEGITIPDNFSFVTEPFKHQIEGLKYGLDKDNFLLADEQGLGKSKQAIDIAIARKHSLGYKHCLIICGVNGLKWNWKEEVEKHSNEKATILGTRTNTKGKEVIPSSKEKLEDLDRLDELDTFFLITNIESLRHTKTVKTKTGKNKATYPIQEKITELAKKGIIPMVVVDEIHKCKNPNSQQGKALLKIDSECKIAMTGTPLMNTPLDLFIVLKWLKYDNHSFYQFKNYHCIMGGFGGYDVVGYKHLPELQEKIDTFMLRRLKKDVLDLPPKTYSTEYIEMSAPQRKVYNEVLTEIKENIDKITISPNPLSQLIRLRQASADTSILSTQINKSAKLDRLEEIMAELVDNGEKAIIFSNWTSVTNPTYKRLLKYNPAIITGETKDRVEQQDKFMNDPTCNCIIGTIGAMGTGLTLTKATTVIFLDSPWNRALKDQAEDRAHRIGTRGTVSIITLVCKDTIDERIEEVIYKKGRMSDILVDNAEKVTPELVQLLLS